MLTRANFSGSFIAGKSHSVATVSWAERNLIGSERFTDGRAERRLIARIGEPHAQRSQGLHADGGGFLRPALIGDDGRLEVSRRDAIEHALCVRVDGVDELQRARLFVQQVVRLGGDEMGVQARLVVVREGRSPSSSRQLPASWTAEA